MRIDNLRTSPEIGAPEGTPAAARPLEADTTPSPAVARDGHGVPAPLHSDLATNRLEGMAGLLEAKKLALAEAGRNIGRDLTDVATGQGPVSPQLQDFITAKQIQVVDGQVLGKDSKPLNPAQIQNLGADYVAMVMNTFLSAQEKFIKALPPGTISAFSSAGRLTSTANGMLGGMLDRMKEKVAATTGSKEEKAAIGRKYAADNRDVIQMARDGKLTKDTINQLSPEQRKIVEDLIAGGELALDQDGIYRCQESQAEIESTLALLDELSDPSKKLMDALVDYIEAEAALQALGIDPASLLTGSSIATVADDPVTVDDTNEQLANAELIRQAMSRRLHTDTETNSIDKAQQDLDSNRFAASQQKHSATSLLITGLARQQFEEAQKQDAKHTDTARAASLERQTERRLAEEARQAAKP